MSNLLNRIFDGIRDTWTPAINVIGQEHSMIHAGKLFYRFYFEADVPDGNSRTSLFRTGDTPPHFKRLTIGASEGPVIVDMGEDAVVTSTGVLVPTLNANRLSSNVAQAQFYDSTTVFSSLGDPILGNLYIPQNGGTGVTGETGALEEIVLKPNTDYSLTLTNDPAGSGTADINIVFVWYEPDF